MKVLVGFLGYNGNSSEEERIANASYDGSRRVNSESDGRNGHERCKLWSCRSYFFEDLIFGGRKICSLWLSLIAV